MTKLEGGWCYQVPRRKLNHVIHLAPQEAHMMMMMMIRTETFWITTRNRELSSARDTCHWQWVSVVSTYPSLMVRMNCSNFLIDLLPRPTVFLITCTHINWAAAFTCKLHPKTHSRQADRIITDRRRPKLQNPYLEGPCYHITKQKLQPSLSDEIVCWMLVEIDCGRERVRQTG